MGRSSGGGAERGILYYGFEGYIGLSSECYVGDQEAVCGELLHCIWQFAKERVVQVGGAVRRDGRTEGEMSRTQR